ncbi:hypothetical protein N7474_000166 [Penicillium riverlandense]|uniref:uncharacterized protein n=1 Tax=Penicillium riverlandense TaxID=1903569 RepID=UPI0025484210|nr:uncharacterized protein N7474_000166 [Penicillium riverlandense]KAJ5831855.1 hypothetical protein N7474_000166 [Penicillium riverlandense]
MSLSPSQNRAIEITERVTSSFSVIGALFVIGTYTASSSFHKPINRMVFYASWGNIIANISTLISLSGIQAGRNTALCQTQGFLIQMSIIIDIHADDHERFMPADALWTLAMACNVWLTFRHRFSASQLRSLEGKYLLLCYGIPFIPAIVYAFLHTEERGKIYGPATLWCWIDVNWDPLRIATFYAPVWLIFIAAGIIYISIGAEIYQKRRQLRSMVSQSQPTVMSMKTTEVHIVSETADKFGGTTQCHPEDDNFQQGRGFSQYAANVSSVDHSQNKTANAGSKMSSTDAAAWAYTKCAMLFFAALLITWVPSTINRVYTLVAAGDISFALCYFEALVLPLQGFWNCIIYITTSLGPCRELWRSMIGSEPASDNMVLSHESIKVEPIAYEPECPFKYNNFVNRITLLSPLVKDNVVCQNQPGCVAIPSASSELILRLTNSDALCMRAANRIENEVAMITLAVAALDPIFRPHVMPRVYS